MVFCKCVCVCVCECVCVYLHTWSGRLRAIGAVDQGKLERRILKQRILRQEDFETERRKEKGGNGSLSSAFCHWQSQDLAALGSRKEFICLGLESAPVIYLQLIMLQLLVFPFSLPSSQMIFKKYHSFEKLFFQCWKNMEKLLNSLGAHCLSLFTVSRWMDNPSNQRGGGQDPLCWVVPCLTSLGAGSASMAPTAMLSFGSLSCSHPWCVGCWERQSHSREPW